MSYFVWTLCNLWFDNPCNSILLDYKWYRRYNRIASSNYIIRWRHMTAILFIIVLTKLRVHPSLLIPNNFYTPKLDVLWSYTIGEKLFVHTSKVYWPSLVINMRLKWKRSHITWNLGRNKHRFLIKLWHCGIDQ